MKKRAFRKRIIYWVDCMMSRGAVAMSVLLFAITAAIVGLIGVIAAFVSDDGNILSNVWNSLMQTLDAGNLSGVPTDNILNLLLMFLATLCGLFLTSILIGIITAGIENKLGNLRKGTSVVQEENHTVIIGFDNNIYAIVRELIEANSNKKKACIVIMGEQAKDEMEDALAAHISDTRTTKIICRSGNLHEAYIPERCSVETCKSVIINIHNDAETVKIILALAAYVKDKKLTNSELRFVALLQSNQYIEAARIAGEGRALIVFPKDAIARIIANTCRQHGLSQVLTELFNFIGNEAYLESVPELEGKSFKEAALSFSNAMVIGLYADGKSQLNPPMNTIIAKNSQLILLEEDDGAYKYHAARTADASSIVDCGKPRAKASDNLLVLGSNEKLPTILEEYAKYVQNDTRVIIVDDSLDEAHLNAHGKFNISVCSDAVTRELLLKFLSDNINNILLLNDDSQDAEASDSQTLMRLILLRDIADKNHLPFSVTTEMCCVDNQRLATRARVDDFVIGPQIEGLLLAQISENPNIAPLIDELLEERGSELYMKYAADYVTVGVPVDSYTLTESAARKGEIYIGYRLIDGENTDVIVNPNKDKKIIFGKNDLLVVISEN